MMHIHDSKQPFARGRIARAASMIFTLVVWLFSAPPTSGAAGEDVMGITGGTLLWEDQFDQAQRQDIAVAVLLSAGSSWRPGRPETPPATAISSCGRMTV